MSYGKSLRKIREQIYLTSPGGGRNGEKEKWGNGETGGQTPLRNGV